MKLNNPYITKRTETLYKLHYKLLKTYERLGKCYYLMVMHNSYNCETLLYHIHEIYNIHKAIAHISKEIETEAKEKNGVNDTCK